MKFPQSPTYPFYGVKNSFSMLKIGLVSGVGTYLSGTARAVPLLKVGRLVMHFAVPLFGHGLHIALMIDVSFKMNEIW